MKNSREYYILRLSIHQRINLKNALRQECKFFILNPIYILDSIELKMLSLIFPKNN